MHFRGFFAAIAAVVLCSVMVDSAQAYPIAARKVAHANGELEEVTEPSDGRREQGAARSLAALVELGKLRGYRNPGAWAQHVMAGRSAKGRA